MPFERLIALLFGLSVEIRVIFVFYRAICDDLISSVKYAGDVFCSIVSLE